MIQQSLCGVWQFRQWNTPTWYPASVPGSNYLDMLALGRIADPFEGVNEQRLLWLAEQDWEYQRTFTPSAELLSQQSIELVCGSLDTLAEVYLNGTLVGKTANMHRTWRWQVKELLLPGENTLYILFRSPLEYTRGRQRERRLPSIMNGGMAHLRKVQSHFGWDWGPSLPPSGIAGEVVLEGASIARIVDVHLRQQHKGGTVRLQAACSIQRLQQAKLSLLITVVHPDGAIQHAAVPVVEDRAAPTVEVEAPRLWWTNGLGEQPLYRVELTLLADGLALDTRTLQVGLRTLELRRSPDDWGESFTFVLNEVPVFARGANWIPADSFITRLSPQRLEHLICSAAQANMNMLRVWGGGYYESEAFYDLADRYGILIWQDFAFACAPYPLDEPEFLENFQQEARQQIRRLRHRASLALWCGNNEIEMMWRLWRRNASLTEAYQGVFHHLLPAWLQQEDPDHAYWFSSPSSGEFLQQPNSDARGDTHLWQVWHGLKPYAYYRKRLTRFCSEFGMESLPDLRTTATFAKPEEFSLTSPVMQHHQRSAGGNEKMLYYLSGRFRLPRSFEDLTHLTQINQAEALRIAVEHWRRNAPRCSGALYWQLNDCWQVCSWSSMDYFGRWKAAHYAARRFFAPLALSVEQSQSTANIWLTNETIQPFHGQVRWFLETLSGQVVDSGQQAVQCSPFQPLCVRSLDFTAPLRQHGRGNLVFVVELWREEERIAMQTALFAAEKDMRLPDPALNAEITLQGEQLHIMLHAQALARFAWLELAEADVIFSDNYFDLPAGRSVEITCPLPEGWTLETARVALRVRSLASLVPRGTRLSDWLTHTLIGLRPGAIFNRILFSLIQ